MSAYPNVATQEFDHDIAWIRKNRKACQLITSKAYEDVGRGAMVVNTTTQSLPGNELGKLNQRLILLGVSLN